MAGEETKDDAEVLFQRIRECQAGRNGRCPTFEKALGEIRAGQKRSHWIWYVWPSLTGIRATTHPELMIPDFMTARKYLREKDLAERLAQITKQATSHLNNQVPAVTLFGNMHHYDAPKFHEVATCFLLAARVEEMPKLEKVFMDAINAIAKGELHDPTVKLVAQQSG